MIEEAQLFEPLGPFELRFGPTAELLQRLAAVAIEADVLEAPNRSGIVAIEGDGCSSKVKGAAFEVANDLYRIGIVHVGSAQWSLDCCHQHTRILHRPKQGRDVLGTRQGLVSLYVYVDVSGSALRDLPYAIGAASVRSRSHLRSP